MGGGATMSRSHSHTARDDTARHKRKQHGMSGKWDRAVTERGRNAARLDGMEREWNEKVMKEETGTDIRGKPVVTRHETKQK